jgi:peptide/nickel transport system permease protein
VSAAESTADEYRRFRRQRLMHRLGRWRKLWQIYYRSKFGKAGFWILVAFAAITLLSPIITLHNPNNFFAPEEDTTVASQELAAPLPYSVEANGTPLAPAGTTVAAAGSYVLYTTTANGSVSAIGLGGSATTPPGKVFPLLSEDFPTGARTFAATSFPLASYTVFETKFAFQYSEFLLLGSTWSGTTHLVLTEVNWTGVNGPGDGVPKAANTASVTLNGTLVAAPASDSTGGTLLPPWGPFYQSTGYTVGGFKPGYVYAVTELGGQYRLTALYTDPFRPIWNVTLPSSGTPSTPVFVGSFYPPPQDVSATQVIIAQNDTLLSYAPATGQLLWKSTFSAPINVALAPVVPFAYEIGSGTANLAFVALGGTSPSVAYAYLSNGTAETVTPVPTPVVGIGSEEGSGGYPAYVAISTATTTYILDGPGILASSHNAIGRPVGFGVFGYPPIYDADSNLMILTSSTGNAIAVSASLGADAIQWRAYVSPTAPAVSAPLFFLDPQTGKSSIGFTTNTGRLDVFATAGIDENPIPPTFSAPSGNIYIFGTNTYGNDVWSQWVASFVWDWEIGLAVTGGIMLIAVLVAMFIGYISSWVATVVETVTLVLFLLPGLALLIVVAAILGASFVNIVLVLTFVGWPYTAFTLIGVVRQVKSRTFVESARASGARTLQILRRHMLPNMTPLLAYFTALSVGGAATALSTLQFLGVAPLTISTWGGMLEPMFGNYYLLVRAPWWVWPPTIALTMFVFAFVFVSRGLDEVVNPRIRAR